MLQEQLAVYVILKATEWMDVRQCVVVADITRSIRGKIKSKLFYMPKKTTLDQFDILYLQTLSRIPTGDLC